MILIDTNVFMYSAGAAHPNKAPSVELLERVAKGEIHGVIDAETLQEILHRYRAIGRWEIGRHVFDLARGIVPEVIPITAAIVDDARDLLDRHEQLTARDAFHAAVALRHTHGAIYSFDSDFDGIEAIRRLDPA